MQETNDTYKQQMYVYLVKCVCLVCMPVLQWLKCENRKEFKAKELEYQRKITELQQTMANMQRSHKSQIDTLSKSLSKPDSVKFTFIR